MMVKTCEKPHLQRLKLDPIFQSTESQHGLSQLSHVHLEDFVTSFFGVYAAIVGKTPGIHDPFTNDYPRKIH